MVPITLGSTGPPGLLQGPLDRSATQSRRKSPSPAPVAPREHSSLESQCPFSLEPTEQEAAREESLDISSSSPDKTITLESTSPTHEDFKVFQDLMRRVAASLGLHTELLRDNTLLPFPLLQLGWKLPRLFGRYQLLFHPLPNRWIRQYQVTQKEYDYFFTHPAPVSLVVTAAHEHLRQLHPKATPKEKEFKRMDLYGTKAYITVGL